jgi:predicted acylesterase/phospholipase RssA
MRFFFFSGPLIAFLAAAAGCAHTPPRFDPAARPTCLVLSVGGPDGVAHLGAVAAVKEARLPVAVVVGNSMGALVGALYASAPGADTRTRFEALARSYVAETERTAARRGLAVGLLFGAVAAVVSGGETVPTLAAGAGGAILGAASTDRLDRERLVQVMGEYFQRARVEALPVRFVTFFQRPRASGLELVAVSAGDLAEAVGSSVANPLLFPDVNAGSAAALDPGADRAAATPVEDACRLFPGMNILAINVTGAPAFTSAAMKCPVLEVRVPPAGIASDAVLAFGPDYDRAIAAGRAATLAALAAR